MGEKRKIYTKDVYDSFVVMDEARRERGKVTEFYEQMLEGLLRLAHYARDESGYRRPVGLMLSFAFTDQYLDYPISAVIQKIWYSFSKARRPRYDECGVMTRKGRQSVNTFKPEYLWAREVKFLNEASPELGSLSAVERKMFRATDVDACPIPYEHYHLILAIDEKKAGWQSIKSVMDYLVDKGVVRRGFHFSENNVTKEKYLYLKDSEDFKKFIFQGAYVCKTDTKELTNRKFWSMSSCKPKRSASSRRKVK